MENKKRLVSYVLLAVAGILIVAGVMSNEVILVLNKSIRICMECIGLG
ncbi:MAG: hypothetical protein K6B41_15290 [Butyrivibrio sp.]|nr:hypothetical protein [Butyrivibrio sp.]